MKTGHAFQAASVTSESKLRQQNQRIQYHINPALFSSKKWNSHISLRGNPQKWLKMLDSPRFSTTRSTRSADQAQWTSPCLLSIHPVQAPPHHLGQSTPGAPRGSEHLKRGPHRAAETRRASAEWPTAMLVAARSAFWVPWSMLKGHLDNSRYNIYIYIYLICDLYDNFHALRQARRVGEKIETRQRQRIHSKTITPQAFCFFWVLGSACVRPPLSLAAGKCSPGATKRSRRAALPQCHGRFQLYKICRRCIAEVCDLSAQVSCSEASNCLQGSQQTSNHVPVIGYQVPSHGPKHDRNMNRSNARGSR